MSYVSIDNFEYDESLIDKDEFKEFYSLFELAELGLKYHDKIFKFIDTNYSPYTIISWRGSYNIPAILADEENITGIELHNMICEKLDEIHEGYKGGEYEYEHNEIFYITLCPSVSSEHAVDGYHVDGNIVWLNTNINPF